MFSLGSQIVCAFALAASLIPVTNAQHTVTVSDFKYSPQSLTAKKGESVTFVFHPTDHSVAQSSQDSPCKPLSDTSFWSGFLPVSGSSFTLMINNTDPIYFYCAQEGHCPSLGMVGVINPPSSSALGALTAAAKKAGSSTIPSGAARGGVVKIPSGGSASASSGSSSGGGSYGGGGGSSGGSGGGAGAIAVAWGVLCAALGMAGFIGSL